jgi:hypothetical protein
MPQDEFLKQSTLAQKEVPSYKQHKESREFSKQADQTLDAFINALNTAVKREV